MRRKILSPRWAYWKRMLGGPDEEPEKVAASKKKEKKEEDLAVDLDLLVMKVCSVWAFFAWRRRAAYRTCRINSLTGQLFIATRRTLREAMQRWTSAVSWLWVAESRYYGLQRALV